MAADLIALVMPSCAAGLWHVGQRATALVGWALWLMTFMFAVTAGLGFASTNISDVTLARASRITPLVVAAQAALGDAMSARDRECKGGVGRFCREREAAVNERRQAFDAAIQAVGQAADHKRTRRSGSWLGQPTGHCNPPAMTSQCFGSSCWRCCPRSAAYCSLLRDLPVQQPTSSSWVIRIGR